MQREHVNFATERHVSLEQARHVDARAALHRAHMSLGREIHVFPLHEYWLDIGRMEDFQRAQFEVGSIFHA